MDCFTLFAMTMYDDRHCEERSNPEKNNKNYIRFAMLINIENRYEKIFG